MFHPLLPMIPRFRHRLRPLLVALCWPVALLAQPPAVDASIEFLYGHHELFPSAIVCFTGESKYAPFDKDQLGDKKGVISAKIKSPAAKSTARVTIHPTAFFAESSVTVELAEDGKNYHVAPWVLWDVEKIAALKQPIANLVVKVTVVVNDGAPRDFYEKIIVHSVNDWLRSYIPRGAYLPADVDPPPSETNAKFMAAAYVNENNPQVDRVITLTGFKQGKLTALNGYVNAGSVQTTTPKASVDEAELSGIYEALRVMQFRYAALSQPSVISLAGSRGGVESQYVRLMGDAIESRQANGVETAAVLAAVYRKMMLHTVLILFINKDTGQNDVLLGIYRSRGSDPKDLIVLDPRALGTGDYAKAKKDGEAKFTRHRKYLVPSEVAEEDRIPNERSGYLWIDIDEARSNGILPVPEPASERDLRGRPVEKDR